MITAEISGQDITNLVDFFTSYSDFTELRFSNEWNCKTDQENGFQKLFVFIYTNFMNRINSDLTVSVMIELKSKSESKIQIISSGGKKGVLKFDNGAEDYCEQKIFNDFRELTGKKWEIKETAFQEN